MRKKIFLSLLASLALGTSCRIIPPAKDFMCEEELIVSDFRRRQRSQIINMPLEDKIKVVESEINATLVPIGCEGGLLSPIYVTPNQSSPLHSEHNSILISALSAKYAVTKDDKVIETANKIIRGIIELDRSNGFDGYIPISVDSRTKAPSQAETHANAYSQLLYSYVLYNKLIGHNPLIEEHVSAIYKRFLKDDFELRHFNGERIRDADLNRQLVDLHPSRALDRRVLDNVAFLLGDEKTKKAVSEGRWRGICVSPNRLNLGFWQIPTTSSSWLNLLKMSTLHECGLDYKEQITSLAKDYSEMKNPFLQILAFNVDDTTDISWVKRRLEEYPYPLNDDKITNSHRKDLSFRRRRFIKTKSVLEVLNPLPLYELSNDCNLWKRNLLSIDRGSLVRGRKYLGVDLLQAYWFYRRAKQEDNVNELE